MEIVEEIRFVIYGKDQLRKNLNLINLKRIFVTGFCYFLIFTYFCAESTYADLTEQYSNMELKTFRKVLFLASKFFSDLIG